MLLGSTLGGLDTIVVGCATVGAELGDMVRVGISDDEGLVTELEGNDGLEVGPGDDDGLVDGPGDDDGLVVGPGDNDGFVVGPGDDDGLVVGPGDDDGLVVGPGDKLGEIVGTGDKVGKADGECSELGRFVGFELSDGTTGVNVGRCVRGTGASVGGKVTDRLVGTLTVFTTSVAVALVVASV